MNMSRPRILHIITRLDQGGSATSTIVSVDLLRKHGFETFLAYGRTRNPDGAVEARLAKTDVVTFHLKHLVRNVSPISDLLALKEMKELLRTHKFDLVHTNTSKAGVLGRLAAAAYGIPAVHTPHGHIFYGYWGPFITQMFVLVERLMARYAARILSLTDIETQESLEKGIGRPNQYVTIHSGVPLQPFNQLPREMGGLFRANQGIPDNAFVFVSVGRLVPIKGFDILLRAFAAADFKDKPVFLAIAGDGDEKERLKSLAVSLGIADRVKFAGQLNDVRPALAAADAFALASRNEGMGRAFIEAMAAGLPVIGTNVGGIPSFIKDGSTGLLVPAGDVAALAGCMQRLVADSKLCETLGKNAAAAVYPEYDEDTMIRKLAELYVEVLGEKRLLVE
jgi:glycosyltransferase involved in cell wall biosynthesis